jgi:hypothetical protein
MTARPCDQSREKPRQVNLLGTILCAIQCETAGWGGLPGALLSDTDCKFQGHCQWDEGSIQWPFMEMVGIS